MEELEKSLLKSVIYFLLAIDNKEDLNLNEVLERIKYERGLLKVYIDGLPDGHIAKKHYQKIDNLEDKDYNEVVEALSKKIERCILDETFENSFEDKFEIEEDVDCYVETIVNPESDISLLNIAETCFYGENKDYAKAVECIEEFLKLDDNIKTQRLIYKCYNILGKAYYRGGYGIEKNYEKAFKFLTKLADEYEDINAISYLAYMYYYGKGTEIDYEKSRKYCEMLVENGDTYYAYFLAEMYLYGKGVSVDKEKALGYFEKSLDKMYDDTYYKLATEYLEIIGQEKAEKYFNKIEKDLLKSIIYLMLAANSKEERNLNLILEKIKSERKLLKSYIERLPDEHISNMSRMYYRRIIGLKDNEYNHIVELLSNKIKACLDDKFDNNFDDKLLSEVYVDLYAEVIVNHQNNFSYEDDVNYLVNSGNSTALCSMGEMLIYGWGVEKNIQKGLEYLKESADQNNEFALFELADIYYSGVDDDNTIIPKNHLKSVDYLNKILEIDDRSFKTKRLISEVYELLGKIYYYGENDVDEDDEKSFNYLKMLENKDKEVLYILGRLYKEGSGTNQNLDLAYKYLKESAEKGYRKAKISLAEMYLFGKGIDQNVEKGIYWLEQAKDDDSCDAMYLLGMIYYYPEELGYNIKRNEEYAIELFTKASEAGMKEASEELEKIKKESNK